MNCRDVIQTVQGVRSRWEGINIVHWAYVQWAPESEGVHEVSVTADHAHKKCGEKSAETDVTVDCDVLLPDELRHVVWGPSEDSAVAAARLFALESVSYGASYSIHYIGEVRQKYPSVSSD